MPDMRTTTLVVDSLIDYELLTQHFKLVRYEVPNKFGSLLDRYKYGRLHNQVRAQLHHPYYFFSYDTQGLSPFAVYVLYACNDKRKDLYLDFLEQNTPLFQREVEFQSLPLHLILKLLQANYFGRKYTEYFSSQGKCYIQAKVHEGHIISLELELKGARQNSPNNPNQEFKVIGQAKRFIKADRTKIHNYIKTDSYFRKLPPKDGQIFLAWMPPNEVAGYENELFRLYQKAEEPTTLNYHSQSDLEHTRGSVLYKFISRFIKYLRKYGVPVYQKVRHFIEYKPDSQQMDIPINELKTVYLLDNRINSHEIPLESYRILLANAYPQLRFESIINLQNADTCPVLVLHDVDRTDFDEGGLLYGKEDPYKRIYNDIDNFSIPKQSININTNDAKTYSTITEYLKYPLCSWNDKNRFDLRFAVCLNELYLKDLLLNHKPILGRLPHIDNYHSSNGRDATPIQHYAFLRRRNHHHTVLYFNDGIINFLDLKDPNTRPFWDNLLKSYDLNWYDNILDPWKQKYFKKNDDGKTPYDFIIGPGQVIEIEDINERVLYEYDKIRKRKQERDRPLPIEAFKLFTHYNVLRAKGVLPYEQLIDLQNQSNSPDNQTKVFHKSCEFLQQLKTYDAFLDEVSPYRREISFHELTSGNNMQEIKLALGLQPTPDTRQLRSFLARHYRKIGMFLSPKAKDVQSYTGIWFDDSGCFMVGSPDSLNDVQARAHLIRKFDVYKGGDIFNINMFLQTMAVKFVRTKQYTVYPYFFHLIEMYIESSLK